MKLECLEPGTVLVIEGPFTAASHARFADRAPEENSDAGREFHARLRARLDGARG